MNQDASSAAGKKIKDSQEESQDIESADKTQRMLDAVTSKMQPLQTLQDDSFQGHLAKTAEDVEEVGACQGFEIFGNTSLGDKYYPETGGLFRSRSPQTRHVGAMLVDAGPALNQHWHNVLCLSDDILVICISMLFYMVCNTKHYNAFQIMPSVLIMQTTLLFRSLFWHCPAISFHAYVPRIISPPWMRKGVSATLWSGGYTLSHPSGHYSVISSSYPRPSILSTEPPRRKPRWTWLSQLLLIINPFLAKLSHLNFHPLEVVSRYRDPQLQVEENYSYLFNLRPKHFQIFNSFRPEFIIAIFIHYKPRIAVAILDL